MPVSSTAIAAATPQVIHSPLSLGLAMSHHSSPAACAIHATPTAKEIRVLW